MKNQGKRYLGLLNLLTGLLIVLMVFKSLHLFEFMKPVSMFHLIIGIGLLYAGRNWVTSNYELTDPINSNKLTRALYNLGIGIMIIAVLFKIMHWPYQAILLIIGAISTSVSFILAMILDPSEKEKNDDIIDDINR